MLFIKILNISKYTVKCNNILKSNAFDIILYLQKIGQNFAHVFYLFSIAFLKTFLLFIFVRFP